MSSHHQTAPSVHVAALALAFIVLGGCIAIPVDYPTPGSRRNIDDQAAAQFEPGVATKEDVLLRLGEPDVVSADQRSFGYAWSRVKFIWAVGSYGGGAVGDLERQSFLRLNFDELGVFTSAEITRDWTSSAAVAR